MMVMILVMATTVMVMMMMNYGRVQGGVLAVRQGR